MMQRLWLRVKAPFAAFRYFQAGVYRATSPTIPHSAAWGLVLNLAGIDIRINENNAITEIDPGAPKMLVAIGSIVHGERNTLYQQLHTYPVGASGKEFADRTKGAKYWIAPVKREILTDFDAMIGVQTEDSGLVQQIEKGLAGQLSTTRYGLPFAGDNNLLFDQIQVLNEPIASFWYTPLKDGENSRKGSCRLSIKIDRIDSSKSTSLLFAPEETQAPTPPDNAWVWTPSQA